MKALHCVAITLLWIGGLNWGIYGVTNMKTNVVHSLLGSLGPVEMIAYVLVGLAAIAELSMHFKTCKYCAKHDMGQPGMGQPSM
jgi:uncharacterized membrane protein YuzA (DUF378 family)